MSKKSISNNWEMWTTKYGNAETGHISATNSQNLFQSNPPLFYNNEEVKVMLIRTGVIKTSDQPKHILATSKYIFVSCLKGKCIQVFNKDYKEVHKVNFDFNCVASCVIENYLYVSLTNFSFEKNENDYIAIVSLDDFEVKKVISAHGKWCKTILSHPKEPYIFCFKLA